MGKGLKITDRDRGYSKLFLAVRAMKGTKLTVGVHEDKGGESSGNGRDARGRFTSTLTVAEVAAINEFGAPAANVPRRSFLRDYFDEQSGEITELLTRAGQAVYRGMDPAAAYEAVGLSMVGAIQARISAGIDPPNAEATIARKGSSKPLIATGQLRSSIESKVEVGG